MAQLKKQPLLSLCIPIYNRLEYLKRQLERFSEDKELFNEVIQLIISDNCSEDDIQGCCKKYQQQGLNLLYHRNDTNIGPDGNFEWCFRHAEGKYVWLLGSDDVLRKGILTEILEVIESNNYGLLFINTTSKDHGVREYSDNEEMICYIRHLITFMSTSIIETSSIKDVKLERYRNTNLVQVPAYLNACLTHQKNAIYNTESPFEDDNDNENIGGYNLFQVFVKNLFDIYEDFVNKGLLSKRTFSTIKRIEYRDFLLNYIYVLLILRSKNRHKFDMTNSWEILFKYYGLCPYAYYYFAARILKKVKLL